MTTVINIKNKTGAVNEVYIGRPSALGNPIAIGKPCMICGQKHDRGGTLVCYRIYLADRLIKDPEFRDLVISLKDKTLVCFCKPLACHGDILAEVCEQL
jgi:hypothetical protein